MPFQGEDRAPFPFPLHLWEKHVILKNGEPMRSIDECDLLSHAIPWVLLLQKAAVASGSA